MAIIFGKTVPHLSRFLEQVFPFHVRVLLFVFLVSLRKEVEVACLGAFWKHYMVVELGLLRKNCVALDTSIVDEIAFLVKLGDLSLVPLSILLCHFIEMGPLFIVESLPIFSNHLSNLCEFCFVFRIHFLLSMGRVKDESSTWFLGSRQLHDFAEFKLVFAHSCCDAPGSCCLLA